MSRKLKRILQKKLGEDFPIDLYIALLNASGLSPADYQIFLLKKYIPVEFKEVFDYEESVNDITNYIDTADSFPL